jgi:MoaA/NifB/PqqE/SkfB family radical SAM enzyme
MRFTNFWTYRKIVFSKAFAAAVWHARKNVLADAVGHSPPFGPYMAEFDITYRCNCRCQMCQRWIDPKPNELTVAEYKKLAKTFQRMGVHQVSIAGGEPLVRDDVFEIIKGFADRNMSVNLCSNGLLLSSLCDQVCQSGATCITVSVDGVEPDTHDAIRGYQGGFVKVLEGLAKIMERPANQRPVVRVRMTINADNQNEIERFYSKFKPMVDDVLLQPVHLCQDAFYDSTKPESLDLDPIILSQQIEKTPWKRDGYLPGLIDALSHSGAYPKQNCYAGVLMARIDPWGNVYPCLEQHDRIGSIRDTDFETLWHSDYFNRQRHYLANGRKCVCWYNNTAVIGHYGDILKQTRLRR